MKLFRVAASVLVLVLAACGGGAPSPSANQLTEPNAWQADFPADSEQVSPEEFKRRLDAGETQLVSTASLAAQKAALDKQFNSDKSFLQGLGQKPEYVQELLKSAANAPGFIADQPVAGPDGPVTLYGLGNQLREAADTLKLAQSVDNALADYSLTYSLLPENLKSQVPTPESLKGKSLAEVQAALSQVNTLLGTPAAASSIRVARLETAPTGGVSAQGSGPGNGVDNNGACTPTNLFARFWFPLKNFISPIKDQGKRGSCWAFTAIGALESRERVQNNNPADLSEQFLVNKVKREWDSEDYIDGYQTEKALQTALSKGQALPSEGAWTYNRSLSRPDGSGEASYANSCNNYNGICSDTAHQSTRVCTTVIFKFCSYIKVNYNGAGVASSNTTQVWASGQGFDLNRYRLLMAQGYVLLASFPVYKGFMDDVTNNGVVSNYAQTKLEGGKEVGGSYGGHAVQIVGFLSNDEMSLPGRTPVNIGGGGYFIIKNSWGCNGGDGGYYYIPADYVSSRFNRLSVLNFDGRRSEAWNREQAAPGGSEAPRIQIRTNPARADLRVESTLSGFFTISHPVAKSVNLTVTSSLDGQLYNGSWSTDPNLLFGSELKRTFTSVGSRTISLVARYGTSQASASFVLNVVNTPPTLDLQYTGLPSQGEDFLITAVVRDINETNATLLCNNTTWAVDGTDTLSSPTGCTQRIKFNTQGSRQVRVATSDSEGATTNQTLNLTVGPPPVNPYPRITSAGVYSREFVGSGQFRFCGSALVPAGNTIDLRELGCTFLISQPRPQRYFGGVEVENPSGETLTYTWRLFVTNIAGTSLLYSGNEATFNLGNAGNATTVTDSCYVTLTVGAPEASRNKSLTVWAGRCTLIVGRLN